MADNHRRIIRYGPLPTRRVIDGFEFHALRTREALREEGAAMKHCVGKYGDKVEAGWSRIYSLRQGGCRVATLELIPTPNASHRFTLEQIKGRRNARAPTAAVNAAEAFVAQVNSDKRVAKLTLPRGPYLVVPARGRSVDARPLPPAAPALRRLLTRRRTDRGYAASEALRRRVGEDIYHAWFAAMEFGAFEGNVLRVTLPGKFVVSWVKEFYLEELTKSCAVEFAGLKKVEVTFRRPTEPSEDERRGNGIYICGGARLRGSMYGC